MDDFPTFFALATDSQPYPWQQRVARDGLPAVATIPTGSGKTAGMVLGWLWRSLHVDPEGTPRRLAFCLPMRTLVEQTFNESEEWVKNLGVDVGVHKLLGGDGDDAWQDSPERRAIIIGTQDMLLSRALNRGYGSSRYRWPRAFGLLNNDVHWIADEVQLMGVAVPTTRQLQAFRGALGTVGTTGTTWMSATIDLDWLTTVDAGAIEPRDVFEISDDDRSAAGGELARRLSANKTIHQLDVGAKPADVAAAIVERHEAGTMTLVVVNTVARAQDLHAKLDKLQSKLPTAPELLLVHSRFRPRDRTAIVDRLTSDVPSVGRIVIATQAVEAGVDIDASTLVTELAPWSSIVQRMGRLNRAGKRTASTAYWIDLAEPKLAPPYDEESLALARGLLLAREGGSAAPVDLPAIPQPRPTSQVIRRRDLLELFDTTPDLTGHDIDIDRFVRSADDTSASVCWRDLIEGRPARDAAAPSRDELCSVPVGDLRDLVKKGVGSFTAWTFDHLTGSWRRCSDRDVRPGGTYLLDVRAGRYTATRGWDKSASKVVVEPIADERSQGSSEAMDGDPLSTRHAWQCIGGHTDDVIDAVVQITETFPQLDESLAGATTALTVAARWHDAGKAHPVFQATMRRTQDDGEGADQATALAPAGHELLAKSPLPAVRHARVPFRHELASLLVYCSADGSDDLAAFLIAGHHGKVRLSIRSMPRERRPPDTPPTAAFACGIVDGDELPEVNLGGGITSPAVTLTLAAADGAPAHAPRAWTRRMLELLDVHGPFRLAALEAILRAADGRASGTPTRMIPPGELVERRPVETQEAVGV